MGPSPADRPASADAPAAPHRRAAGLVAALLLFAAGAYLRLHDVATLSVNGDEIYTLWETRSARTAAEQVDVATAWRQRLDLIVRSDPPPPPGLPGEELWRLRWGYRTNPLHLLVNEAAFRWLGDTPLAARLSSLLFGLASLLVFPWLARGLWGGRFALIVLAVVALAPNAIEHARFARYYSASLFFGGVAALAAARFTLHRRRFDELLFVAACVLLVASHITGALVAGVLFLWMAAGARSRVCLGALGVALAAAAAYWILGPFGPIRKVTEVIQGGIKPTASYRSWRMAASLYYNVGPGLVALGGLALLWWPRAGRRLAIVPLGLAVLVPSAILFSLNYRHDVGPRYFAAIEGVGLVLAACGLARLLDAPAPSRFARWSAALLLGAQAPLLASNWVDGQRFPYAEAVARVVPRLDRVDRILSDWHGIVEYCLEVDHGIRRNVLELPDKLALLEERLLEGKRERAVLLVPRQRGKLSWPGYDARFEAWLEQNATLLETIGRWRLDTLLEPVGAGYRFEISIFEVELAPLRARAAAPPDPPR